MVLYGRQWLSAELVLLLSVLHEEHVCGGPEGCAKHINIINTYFLREELVYGQVMSYWEDSIGFFFMYVVFLLFRQSRFMHSHYLVWKDQTNCQYMLWSDKCGCIEYCTGASCFASLLWVFRHSSILTSFCFWHVYCGLRQKVMYTSVMYIWFTHDTLF